MRASPLLLALPLASAQQIPLLDELKGWFAKATQSFASAVEKAPDSASASIPDTPDPVAAAPAPIVELNVENLNVTNYNKILRPEHPNAEPGIETWMVFVTGGNQTCYGMCAKADTAFNESVPLLAASPKPPKLGLINCETDGVLCHAWAVSPPSLYYLQLPQPLAGQPTPDPAVSFIDYVKLRLSQADQPTPASTVRFIKLNRTTVTAPEIAGIHLREKYLETEPYEGFFHPFDGLLAQSNASIPFGFVVWYLSKIPSWAMMIGISIFSRTIMGRRMAPAAGRGSGVAPAGAPATR